MKFYAVKVTGYVPYPIVREYVEKSSSLSTAVGRAIRKYKKDDRIKRRRFNQLTVNVGF